MNEFKYCPYCATNLNALKAGWQQANPYYFCCDQLRTAAQKRVALLTAEEWKKQNER
jgi:hypothetical protein